MGWFDLFFYPTIACVIYLWFRNNRVYREQQRVIAEIGRLGLEDIQARRPFWWRWEAFWQVSYEKMLFSFRPVKSFFADSPMLQPGKTEDWPSITCPDCGLTSYNPHDIAQKYCGFCHWWTSDPDLAGLKPEAGKQ